MEEIEIKWVSEHYCSSHSILIVGDGDFSFSLSLATSFDSGENIVATSLDSHEALLKKYSKAQSNLEKLKELEATVLHGVDATKMKLHSDLNMRKFDRIVFNFPHAGFRGKEDELHLINMHRNLVLGFVKNARQMLRPYGEIHVSHKTGEPYNKWNLEELAMKNSLFLTEQVQFNTDNFPGYNNKRGDGKNCDEPFHLGECSIFKFRLNLSLKPVRVQRPIDRVEFHSFVPVQFHDFVPVPPCGQFRDFVPARPSVPFHDFVPVPPCVPFHDFVPAPPFVPFHDFVPPRPCIQFHDFVRPPNVFGTGYDIDVNVMVPRVSFHANNFVPDLGFGKSLINNNFVPNLGFGERHSYEREMHERMLVRPPTQLYATL